MGAGGRAIGIPNRILSRERAGVSGMTAGAP